MATIGATVAWPAAFSDSRAMDPKLGKVSRYWDGSG